MTQPIPALPRVFVPRLYDSNFATRGLHAYGDFALVQSLRVEWLRTGPPGAVNWFTDSHLRDVLTVPPSKKVAWLLEPRELHPENYDWLQQNADLFDAVLTHDEDLALAIWQKTTACLYPMGGTHIHPFDWGIHPKDRHASLTLSHKRSLLGHQLRHRIAQQPLECPLDLYGDAAPSGERVRMIDALRRYRFGVMIENVQRKHWFTAQLLDACLTGTVPVYWGAPNLTEWGFDSRGIIQLDESDPIAQLNALTDTDYARIAASGALQHNLINAIRYVSPEDWLASSWPELFHA